MDIKSMVAGFGALLPLLGAALFALPSYYGVLKQRKGLGLLILILLCTLAVGIPTIAIKAGIPYDSFAFSNALGPRFLNTTPWSVALIYPPLLLITFWFASKFTRSSGRVMIGSILTLVAHLIIDPAAVKLELWKQGSEGVFYGVPLLNFAAWFMVGLFGILLLHLLWGKEERVKAPVAYSGLGLLLFWTGVNAGVTQKVPVGIGSIYVVVILLVVVLERQQFKEEN